MKSSAYWDKRMKLLEQSRYDGNVRSYHEIETIYNKQIAEMEKEIAAWYQRFANNNQIDLADARKLLDAKELQELKWNVEDYIKYGRENALDPKWVKQLENASARYHISRLEALQLQLQQRAESVIAAEQDVVDERVRDVYQENYYHTAFEIQRGIGIGWDLERLDERRIDRVISKPWAVDGKNFSERIWEQRDKLVNVLHQELSQSIIRGEDPERAIKALSERMNVAKSSARRLIMTESAAFASEAQQECYNELDVEQYKIVATLDDVTSPLCQSLDGKVFKMSEYAVGSTAPPFHVNCRTVTVPYFADDNDSKRAARGADGKTYLVPANTTYKEWKGAFVDGEEKPFKVENTPKATPEPKVETYVEKINPIREEFNNVKQEYNELDANINTLKNANDADDQKRMAIKNSPEAKADADIIFKKFKYGNFDFDAEINRIKNKMAGVEPSNQGIYKTMLAKTISLRDEIQSLTPEKEKEINARAAERKKKYDAITARIVERNAKIKEFEIQRTEVSRKFEPIIQKAGKVVFDEVMKNPELRNINEEYQALVKRNSELSKAYNQRGLSFAEKAKIADEWTKTYKEMTAKEDSMNFENAANVKSLLGKIRNMGSDGVDVAKHLNNSRSQMRSTIENAYSHYPNEWVKASEQRGDLTVKSVTRGYYNDNTKVIAISGDKGSAFKTSIHELGHRMERVVPLIRDLEQVFYERRTNGEQLVKLKSIYPRSGYRDNELTRKDNFINAYMGKDYQNTAYELVSMGFENAFCNPAYLEADPDYAQFIYGILTLV